MTSHTTAARAARAAAVALAAGVLMAGCSFVDGPRRTARADTVVTEAVTAVEVTGTRAGSIEVTAAAGPGVTVRRTVHYRGDTAPVTGQQVSGGVLTFTDGCSGNCSIDYRLEVPATAKVTLESDSGDITVTGVAAAEVEADSGDVRAEAVTGPLRISTSSGEITATGLTCPSAAVHSDSGDTRVEFAKAPSSVLAETTSGDVSLKVPAAPYRLSVDTTSGARDVTLPDDASAPARLSAKTTSGDVRISPLNG
ncbi:DUF4097 family beta strand repeat-containing protein [Streptomyces erythrochromogenes]|uniref:DUF4097 family beta strand repeat-containing protein n=1 Tax=Streptomyces erythrochromogenes TaxID=285574 RepID=UPI00342CEA77